VNTFHFLIESPKFSEAEKIAEHLPPAVLYASVDPIQSIRMLSRDLKEEDVPFVYKPGIAETQKDLPFKHHIAFESRHSIRTWLGNRESGEIIAQVHHPDASYDLLLIPIAKYRYREFKEIKFNKYADILACPSCRGKLTRDGKNFSCETCHVHYPFTGNAVDVLPEKLRAEFSIRPTENVSDWGLDTRVIDTVLADPDKLYLDVGAGFTCRCFENVVNLEIVDYPPTDVLGVGEKLPFLDASFDGVISLVVLEHVKDPFGCAREMMRVLKPGGELFCSAPFLQPYHGFPNHYYNMTHSGLVNLFPGMEIKKVDVPSYLHPMAAITWIMNSYAGGLPEALRKQFLSLKIEDLLALFAHQNYADHPLCRELPFSMQLGLACGTFIHANKPR
jgi:Methylase involved in ubiquinone/menaquinone biosynthesis